MKFAPRRVVIGALATALTAGVAGVSLNAMAEETPPAEAPPVKLVVGVKPGADAATPVKRMAAATAGVNPLTADAIGQRTLAAINAHTLEVSAANSATVIAKLRNDPNVTYVEVDAVRKATDVTPNDPLFSKQPELARLNVPTAWDTTTGSAVTVAVVDTGVADTGDLAGAVLPGYDFANDDSDATDDEGHGTKVASLIAARGNNAAGMAGVCWQCSILPVKVLAWNGYGYDSDIAKGIVYATDKGAKIINMSLSGELDTRLLRDAVAYANLRGVLVVAAAGNEGTSRKMYPAAYPDVLAVGGTGVLTGKGEDETYDVTSDDRVSFSSYGDWVDVAAPGCVTAMDRSGQYGQMTCGTSFSAPLVAGVAALVKSQNPSYSGWSLTNSIVRTARPIGSWVKWGMVDAPAAVALHTDRTKPTITGCTPVQNSRVRGVITVTANGVSDSWSGIRNVALYVDGKYHSLDTTAPYQFKYDTSKRNGVIKMQLRVSDKAGNTNAYDRTLTADNVAPTVKITKAPKNKAKVKGTVKISVAANDKYGINRVELLINGKVVQTDRTAGYTFSFKAKKQPKKMKILVRAYDKTGNVKYDASRNWTR